MPGRLAKQGRIVLVAATLLAGAAHPAAGQRVSTGPASAEGGFGDRISVGYVLVPVVVRGRQGFADELEADDFHLTVDGRPVALESFESGAMAPIGVLFLQDLSGSMGIGDKLTSSRDLVRCVLRRRRDGDEFAVATFSDRRLFVEVPFPGSTETIGETLADWTGYGRTALHDAVAWLPDLVHASANPRRAVVLVTDGVDNASLTPPGEARDEMRQAEVPVHVVGLETGSPYRLDRKGEKVHRQADTLNLIAWATGGRYHPVENDNDVEAACADIVSSLRHQYVLGFSTSDEGEAGERTIEVTVAGRDRQLDVRSRRSYLGTLPTTITETQ